MQDYQEWQIRHTTDIQAGEVNKQGCIWDDFKLVWYN